MGFVSSLDFLEFRDPKKLQNVIYTHSVKPHEVSTLCVVPPSTLLFVDRLKRCVHRLVCSGITPIVFPCIACDYDINDICYAKHFHENLVIVACSEGLQASSIGTGKVKWNINDVHLPGQNAIMNPFRIAAGGKGRLFVFDVNNRCIQVFSASEGQYLGRLIRNREHGLGDLWGMCFSEAASQLIVSHRKEIMAFIAVLNVG